MLLIYAYCKLYTGQNVAEWESKSVIGTFGGLGHYRRFELGHGDKKVEFNFGVVLRYLCLGYSG